MNDIEGERCPEAMDAALRRYFDLSERGDVNEYLDEQKIAHQPVTVRPGQPEPNQVEMPTCPEGYHLVESTYYNKHDGWNTVSSCVWNTGLH